MSHLNEVIARVDAAIDESVIAHMNELLIQLSDDAELTREDRYTQQQRLRTTALLYLSQHETPLQPRFDVIEIYAPDGTQTRRPQITHMEDAF